VKNVKDVEMPLIENSYVFNPHIFSWNMSASNPCGSQITPPTVPSRRRKKSSSPGDKFLGASIFNDKNNKKKR